MSLSHIIDKDKLNSFAQQAIPPIKTTISQLGTALGALSDELDGIENGLGTASAKDVPSSGDASLTQVVMGNDTRLSDSRPASDVYEWAKAPSKPSYSKSEVGLDKVGNFKAVSTESSQGLTSTEQSNARSNIGVGSVQDNLTSDSTTDSLSAKQGKELNTRLTTVETFINNLGVAETTSF